MKKTMLSLFLSFTMLTSLAAPALAADGDILDNYSDLDPAGWYIEAVRYAVEGELMTGGGDGTFAPLGTVTRAMVFHTLWNMEGQPAPKTETGEENPDAAASFPDVEGTWYAGSAAWAENAGLANGDETGAYAGERAVTRAEIATMFARYMEFTGFAAKTDDLSGFVDAADVADWAKDGMSAAVGSGVVSGKDGGRLDPNGTAVRAELAQVLLNLSKAVPAYTVTKQGILVPETDGIPAHVVPAVITLPAGAENVPAVVMLHGTGSTKDEAGDGYITASQRMALNGVATIRIDFMGNGESEAGYIDYNYTSANLDAKAAADYMAGLDEVNGRQIAVMGWSQGGTNALTAAAAYPETFSAVITWAGALDLQNSGLFPEGFEAAYDTAKENGSYEMTFDWRGPLQVGERWFQEVAETDMEAVVASIEAPILAINGLDDTTVPPANAEKIAEAGQNARAYLIENCDHTFNVFTEDAAAIQTVIDAGLGFLGETYGTGITGSAAAISKYGNVTTTVPLAVFEGAGYEAGDILNVTVNGQTITAPYGTDYSNVDSGLVIVLPDSSANTIAVAINMGNFAGTYGVEAGTELSFSMHEKAGYRDEYLASSLAGLRTNDRADYDSDEIFANFRNVALGNIPEGRLYRSSSPVNPELGRNTYADALMESAGVKTVLNLADSQEALEAYEGYGDSYYAAAEIIPLNLGIDFADSVFNAKLCSGLAALAEKEGPYLVHCTEGKDRAGFVCALLEALCGASKDEIVNDYMLSFENYYHIEHGSEQWQRIAQSNIVKTLCSVAGVETEAELAGADLAAAAEAYLTGTVGMTAEQVEALRTALTAPVEE